MDEFDQLATQEPYLRLGGQLIALIMVGCDVTVAMALCVLVSAHIKLASVCTLVTTEWWCLTKWYVAGDSGLPVPQDPGAATQSMKFVGPRRV